MYVTVKRGRELITVERHEDLNLKPDLLQEERLNTNVFGGETTFIYIKSTCIRRWTLMSDQSSSFQVKSDHQSK